MATHEVRQMMLDKSIRETLAMPTGIETEKANVEPNDDRPEFAFTNRIRTLGEKNYLLKVDRKRSNLGNTKESRPIGVTNTSVLDRIGLVATGE